MNDIKKGDIVGRKSYGMDIIFIVKNKKPSNFLATISCLDYVSLAQ